MKNPITYCRDTHCNMGAACCGCPGEREARAQHNASYKLPANMEYLLIYQPGNGDMDLSEIGGMCAVRSVLTQPICSLFLDTDNNIYSELPIVWLVNNVSDVDERRVWETRHNKFDRVYDGRVLVGLEPAKTEMPRVQQILSAIPPATRAALPEDDLEAALAWSIMMLGI